MHRQSEKNLLNSDTSSTCPNNMVNFGLPTAEICWQVWGTPANFNWFRVLAALLHSIPVVGVSQTLRRWTEGATYIRQGVHHVGHWPTFLVINELKLQLFCGWLWCCNTVNYFVQHVSNMLKMLYIATLVHSAQSTAVWESAWNDTVRLRSV